MKEEATQTIATIATATPRITSIAEILFPEPVLTCFFVLAAVVAGFGGGWFIFSPEGGGVLGEPGLAGAAGAAADPAGAAPTGAADAAGFFGGKLMRIVDFLDCSAAAAGFGIETAGVAAGAAGAAGFTEGAFTEGIATDGVGVVAGVLLFKFSAIFSKFRRSFYHRQPLCQGFFATFFHTFGAKNTLFEPLVNTDSSQQVM